MWLGFLIEIEEHDHIKEEHHDGACINDDVHDGEELCVHENVVPGDAEECDDKIKDAVNGIARDNDHDGREYRKE